MRKPRPIPLSRHLRYVVEAGGFFLAMGFFRLCGLDRASSIGAWIGRHILAPTRLSDRAYRNLRLAYPDMPESERRRIVHAMWDNLGRTGAEYAHLDRLHSTGDDPRIRFTGLDNIEAVRPSGKGMVLISAHTANWEIMPYAVHEYGLPGGMVVRPPNNPHVARWIARMRARSAGQEQIPKGISGTRRIFTRLRKGETICMLVDQRASEGIPVPFFGQDAMTTPLPAAFALKLGAAVLPVSNVRVGGARFHLHVHPAIVPPNTGDEDKDLLAFTAAITAFVENEVRARPEQWLWIHKRWQEEGAVPRKRAQALMGTREDAAKATSSRV